MYTRCPECQTIFRIHEEQLRAADGQVRCGECMGVFDGEAHRLEKLPDGEPAEGVGDAQAASAELPGKSLDDGLNIETLLKPPDDEATLGRAAPGAEVEDLAFDEEPPPRPVKKSKTRPKAPELKPRKKANPVGTFLWTVVILALIGLLLGQYGYYHREALSRKPLLRPWLEQLCTVAGCELPPPRDVEAIELLERQVQSHPRYRDTLLITGTLVNRASFAQPYPLVELSLRDMEGAVVASRRFLPQEYLTAPAGEEFGPGAEAALLLEVADPGERAVGFEFSFH